MTRQDMTSMMDGTQKVIPNNTNKVSANVVAGDKDKDQ